MKINPSDHIALIPKIANRYHQSSGEPFDDLFQEGYIGLHTAAKNFNPELGYRFSCFAYAHIRGAITHYLRDKSRTIRNTRGKSPVYVQSLDRPVTFDSSDTLLDSVPDEQSLGANNETEYVEILEALENSNLTAKQKQYLNLYYFQKKTRDQISEELGVCKQTVTNNLFRARDKLKVTLLAA